MVSARLLWLVTPKALAGVALATGAFSHQAGGAQAPLASKSAKFGSIAASSPELKKALDCKDLAAGLKLAGKTGSFTGVIVSVYTPRTGNDVYLDFSQPYENTISGQVAKANFSKFPKLSTLRGKRVLITGKFFAYRGTHPEVEVESPAQIKIVK